MNDSETHRPVVLLHGFLGTGIAHFGRVLRAWYGRYPLMPLDLPGHGKCPMDAPADFFDGSLAYVVHRIRKLGPVRLIGVSYLGGTLAIRLAVREPVLVDSLVVSGFTYDVPEAAFVAWSRGFSELAARRPELVAEYDRLHGSRWQRTLDAMLQDCERSYEHSALTAVHVLKELRIATAIVNGDFKQNEQEAATRANGLTRYLSGHVVPRAGHIVPYDQPELFCRIVESFWDTQE